MIIGPVFTIGGVIALFFLLGGKVPDVAPGWFVVPGIFVVGWWLTTKLFPEKRCWRCKGRGQYTGPFKMRRVCGACKGSGRVSRIGVQ